MNWADFHGAAPFQRFRRRLRPSSMRADKFYADGLLTVGDSNYQAIVVTFDREDHCAVLEDAGVKLLLFRLGRLNPRWLYSIIHSCLQILLGARVSLPGG